MAVYLLAFLPNYFLSGGRYPYSECHSQRQYDVSGKGFAALTLHVSQNETFPTFVISFLTYTAKNSVISPDFLVWKFCRKVKFRVVRPKLCGNFAFPQNLHTGKSGEITVFFAVLATLFVLDFRHLSWKPIHHSRQNATKQSKSLSITIG